MVVAIVGAVLTLLPGPNLNRRALVAAVWAVVILLLAACGSDDADQAQVISVTPTSLPTTAPLALPTQTPAVVPTAAAAPLATAVPVATAEPTPTPLATPTSAPVPAPSPTAISAEADAVESPTPLPTEIPAPTATAIPASTPAPTATPIPSATEVPVVTEEPEVATPTAVVVASGEPPLECYDAEVRVYRAYVEGVDTISMVGGSVHCSGAGTNAVSAAASYRHSSGLIMQRNADFIFNEDGTAYIPYSGALHFCVDGQALSAALRADTVPSLLVVIDNEARRLVSEGAVGPAAFSSAGSLC